MENFIVSHSPFVHSGNDINKMFLYISIALTIPAIYGVMFFGLQAFFIILLSVASCAVFELVYNLITKKKFVIEDFSFFLTGMILALTMPYKAPLWVVVLSAFFAIIVVKIAFGGLGRNKFNPAGTARCFAGVVASGFAGEFYTIIHSGEQLSSIALGGSNEIVNLLIGQSIGGIGTTCIIIILLCYVFLVYTGVIDFKIPIIAVLSYLITSLIFTDIDHTLINVCSGSFLFVSVFMLTDPNTSPDSVFGKFIYSIMFGVLSALVWNLGVLGENTSFAVLLFVNLFVPMMDTYLVWKPVSLGGLRNAHKN